MSEYGEPKTKIENYHDLEKWLGCTVSVNQITDGAQGPQMKILDKEPRLQGKLIKTGPSYCIEVDGHGGGIQAIKENWFELQDPQLVC